MDIVEMKKTIREIKKNQCMGLIAEWRWHKIESVHMGTLNGIFAIQQHITWEKNGEILTLWSNNKRFNTGIITVSERKEWD